MIQVGDFTASDARALEDGRLQTTLVDANGYAIGTVTRSLDGTTTASVDRIESSDARGYDWQSVLGKVTDFLDDVAKAAATTSEQAQRISNAARGAAAGAQAGYVAPLNWKPWAIAGAVVLGVVVLSAATSRRR